MIIASCIQSEKVVKGFAVKICYDFSHVCVFHPVVLPDSPNFPYRRYDRLPPIHQFSIESDSDLSETAELIEEYEVFDPSRPRPKVILIIGECAASSSAGDQMTIFLCACMLNVRLLDSEYIT